MDDLKIQNSPISLVYTFHENIEKVWDCMKRMDKTTEILTQYQTDFQFLKGENTFVLGNEFKYKWKDRFFTFGKVNYIIIN